MMADYSPRRPGQIFIDDSTDDSDEVPSPSPFSPSYGPAAKRHKSSSDGSVSSENESNPVAQTNGATSSASLRVGEQSTEPSVLARQSPKFAVNPVKPASEATRNAKKDAETSAVDLRGDGKDTPEMVAASNGEGTKRVSRSSASPSPSDSEPDEIVTKYIQLDEPVEHNAQHLSRVTLTERQERDLELALQLDMSSEDGGWRTDWCGNLALFFEEVPNPETRQSYSGRSEPKRAFFDWASTSEYNKQLIDSLLILIHNMEGTPPMAKLLLRWAFSRNNETPRGLIKYILRRISYDPQVLREDGWITKKSREPEGATGGAYNIGKKIMWQNYEAVVIAYVHDDDLGDLWKAMWLEDFETFDVEAEELGGAIRKWERKNKPSEKSAARDISRQSSSARFAEAANFTVEGIEYGIVYAASYHPDARQGVLWPARIRHATEVDQARQQSRRSSAKHKVKVVFLAPYWNARDQSQNTTGDAFSRAKSLFSSGPLLEVDQIDVSGDTIQPYDIEGGLNIDQLQSNFRFTGLPKNAFPRFLDSHRLAMGLKMYAKRELETLLLTQSDASAKAALIDTHPLMVQTAHFPPAVLHLPFEHILSKLPQPKGDRFSAQRGEDNVEPPLDLGFIMKAMEPPSCWGTADGLASASTNESSSMAPDQLRDQNKKSMASPGKAPSGANGKTVSRSPTTSLITVNDIASEFLMEELARIESTCGYPLSQLLGMLNGLISQLWRDDKSGLAINSIFRTKFSTFLRDCLMAKGHGEDIISSSGDTEIDRVVLLREWRKACERLYKEASCQLSASDFGNGITVVITDSRCNEHITSNGSVERPVRLPAALKGSRLAKRELSNGAVHILPRLKNTYIELAGTKIIQKAHSKSYIEKMRDRCAGLDPDTTGAALTEDSGGEGGEDTDGSQGSFNAAVAGVAAAIKGVDMIVGGQCVNGFCATRPPGHHAGRHLHPMKTHSNGFCILNPAACAAVYAATPLSEGGIGLRRVCVIDFDVHHGNGTQDILCSTEDPRFLYVSLHAGGPEYNGYDSDDDSDAGYRTSFGSRKQEIFPGRCGDKSPHAGVLNIPLGGRFTANAVGKALLTRVTPAVEQFSPDLIILSAGFDGHQNDPLGLGGLSAANYGHITKVACDMAHRVCGGRLLSILEGGYGVPCCRPQEDLFLPPAEHTESQSQLTNDSAWTEDEIPVPPPPPPPAVAERPQPSKLADLGDDLPEDMDDQMPYNMQKSLERCHGEGFIDCVREHVKSLGMNNERLSVMAPPSPAQNGDDSV